MAEDRNKILSKAQKLKALADRGVENERQSAKMFLERYMAKHNITEDELSGYVASANPNSSDLSTMTDDEFMAEMIREMIPVSLGVLFGRYGDDRTRAKTNADASQFINRFFGEIVSRVDKINNKNKKRDEE